MLHEANGAFIKEVPLLRDRDGWWSSQFLADSDACYGLRVDGPYEPSAGYLHNPKKLLLDPYGRRFVGKLKYGDETRIHAPYNYLGLSEIDSLGSVPLTRLPNAGLGFDRPASGPNWKLSESLIYEMHVKSATARMPSIPPVLRGTYLGVSSNAFIEHLLALSVTAVELLPIFYFADSEVLLANRLVNHWGYSTISYFAPDPRYATSYDFDVARTEFAEMVDTLHANGIEVILDVVYNHTGEGDISGPTFSYRGISANDYYLMEPFGRYHVDLTGCGNTLNASSPLVQQLIVDSLVHFANDYSVDGFRFDLATSLGRSHISNFDYPFSQGGGVLGAIANNPSLSKKKLIAEPWDLGFGGYQIGRFPQPFLEWNDRFRDYTRRSIVAQQTPIHDVIAQIIGNNDPLARERSINFVTCHDGFTLRDLVSFNFKRNRANHEDNRDGANQNYSNNFGEEGLYVSDCIIAARDQSRRLLLAALAIAPGIPMVLGGDEIGRTQFGNNNAYCQDRLDYSYDWEHIDVDFLAYFTEVFKFRKNVIARCDEVEDISERLLKFRDDISTNEVAILEFRNRDTSLLARVCFNAGDQSHVVDIVGDSGVKAYIAFDSTGDALHRELGALQMETGVLIAAKSVIAIILEE